MERTDIENITIIRGDCMEYMGSLGGDRGLSSLPAFDLAVVDPDYGLGSKLRGGQWAEKWGKDGMMLGGVPDWEYFARLMRVCRNQVVWGGNYFAHLLPPTRCFLVWDKKEKMSKMADCEMAWTSFDRNAKVFSSARNPGGLSGKGRIHICQKPVQLYMWVYGLFGEPGCRVLDTHMGSGSSAIAVYEMNRKLMAEGKKPMLYTGIEINETYYEKAVERVLRHIEAHPYENTAMESNGMKGGRK